MRKYRTILADPPWAYNDKLGSNSAKMGACEYHYKTMPLEDICSLSINKIADDNCLDTKIAENYKPVWGKIEKE